MRIKEFTLEKWLNPRKAKYTFGASGMRSFDMDELFETLGQDMEAFFREVGKMNLHYGHFLGLPRLLKAISGLYRDLDPELVLTMHGGTGANNAVITEFVEPEDNVVAIFPSYQQHYSTPEWLGAEVRYLELLEKDGYLPDLEKLAALVDKNTKMITLTNPNNPAGSFMDEAYLKKVADIADSVGAYILSDECYRGLEPEYMPSIVDIYKRGIVTSSMSKAFGLAGTRLGWVASQDPDVRERMENRRSFDTICCGVFDELLVSIALENYDRLMERNRKILYPNRELVEQWLKTQPHLSANYKSKASVMFLKYDYGVDAEKLGHELFYDGDIMVCHGGCFEIPKSFRIGFGYATYEKLQENLAQLGNFLKRYE